MLVDEQMQVDVEVTKVIHAVKQDVVEVVRHWVDVEEQIQVEVDV